MLRSVFNSSPNTEESLSVILTETRRSADIGKNFTIASNNLYILIQNIKRFENSRGPRPAVGARSRQRRKRRPFLASCKSNGNNTNINNQLRRISRAVHIREQQSWNNKQIKQISSHNNDKKAHIITRI